MCICLDTGPTTKFVFSEIHHSSTKEAWLLQLELSVSSPTYTCSKQTRISAADIGQ